MAVKASVVPVGTTPVRADVQPDQDNRIDQTMMLFNPSITASGATQGFPIPPGQMTPPIPLLIGSQIWAVSSLGTVNLNVVQIGV